jgi:transcriptional regulator with XRE-family HTH domain
MKVKPFSELLKHYRELHGISQSKLGELAGLDHSYISKLESNHRNPDRSAVDKVARALNLSEVSTDKLLAGAGFLPRNANNLLETPELRYLSDLMMVMPEPLRADVRAMLRIALRVAKAEK